MSLGLSFYGSIETIGDHDWLRMELGVGSYQVRLHGVGTLELDNPTARLLSSAGATLATYDDYAGGWGGSNASDPYAILTIATAGTYYLDVSSFVQGSTSDDTGGYLVTLVPGGGATPLVHTFDEIAWQLTNNFNEDVGYSSAFAFNVGSDGQITYNVTKLTAAGATLAEAALAVWGDVTGIEFVATTSSAAEIDFDDSASGVNAYASSTVSGTTLLSSDVMITTGWLGQFGTGFASYSFETYIHEIGHALGLGHGGNYNGSSDNAYYENDSLVFSIMSYLQVDNDEFTQGLEGDNPNIDASFRYMQTMAIADIIAIRNLYGLDTDTRAGATTYGFSSNTGNAALDAAVTLGADMFMCVYDDGGKDTLNFGLATVDQLIDLNDESFSNVLGGRMNLSIARGAVIENAVGGGANDTLIGNDGANALWGGADADTIKGADGVDSLYGGLGADRLEGGAGIDYARYDDANYGALKISLANPAANTGAAAGDRYVAVEGLVGGLGNDQLGGNDFINYLYGGGGADTIAGNGGKDLLSGGAGQDVFVFATVPNASTNLDRIMDFSAADDTIQLNKSAFAKLFYAGPLKAALFYAGTAAHDADDRIIYDQATGSLFYDADGTAAVAAILFATLDNKAALTAADFVVA